MSLKDSPGAVVVPTADLARYVEFWQCKGMLALPLGSTYSIVKGLSIAQNLNLAFRNLLKTDLQWAWIIGDDHVFHGDVVMRLLEHEIDDSVIMPLCLRKRPAFETVLFREVDNPGEQDEVYEAIPLDDLPTEGIIEVFAAGSAGMLVPRKVIEKLENPKVPWFQMMGEHSNEDIVFCALLRMNDIPILCDLDTRIGHITTTTIWPTKQGDEWRPGADFGADFQTILPIPEVSQREWAHEKEEEKFAAKV